MSGRSSAAWVSAAGVTLADRVPASLRRSWVSRGHCPDRDLFSLFSEHVRACPERVAVAWAVGQLSYAELDRKARAAAAALADAGLTARDIIAIALPSDWRAVVAELAVAAVGAVALPYPAGRGCRDAGSLLGRARASAVITAGAEAEQLVALRPSLPWLREVFTFGPGDRTMRGLDGWLAAAPDWRPPPADPEAPARILVSSGSEAEPTMVAYSHNAMAGGRANYIAALHHRFSGDHGAAGGNDEPMRNLILVPLASSYGSCATSVTIARHGGTVLLGGHFDPVAAVAMTAAHRPFLIFGVPTMLRRMADLPPDGEFPALRALISSGAPLPASTAAACAARFGVPVVNVYGSSDGVNCHAVVAGGGPGDAGKPGFAGYPDPAVAVIRVADADGNALPSGREGEIQALGPMTPLCYVNAPELDARYSVRGGWVRTGDSGVLGPDGSLRVTGRIRQVIIRGGYNISAAEVEHEISAHPLVSDAACVAVPDADLGERVCACIAQRPGTPPLTAAALAAFLETERGLPRVKLPEFLLHLPELPLGPTGKVSRPTLARLAVQAATKAQSAPKESP